MKIIVIIDHWFPSIGGGPVHVGEILSRVVKNKDTKITILTSNLQLYKSTSLVDPYLQLNVIRLGPKGRFTHLSLRLQFLINLFIYLLFHDFDAIHVHPFFPIPVAWVVCKVKRKPILVTIHGIGQDIRGLSVGASVLRFVNKIITFFYLKQYI